MSLFIIASIVLLQFFMPKKATLKPVFDTKFDINIGHMMKPEKIRKVVLDNGMTVLIFKNEASPKVLLQIVYDIGSWVEDAGEKGMAHLIEHMIFKGTDKLSESDIDAISRKYGASINAFTSKDMTSYYFEVNKNNWHPFVSILADSMQNARFDPQHLASEYKTVIQELRMYRDKYWNAMLEKAAELIFPPNHPYHYPIIGFREDLVGLDAQDLKNFYKKYYKPERATLFMVGNLDLDEAEKVARKNFANIKVDGSASISEEKLKEKFPAIHISTTIHKTSMYENVKKEQLGLYWLVPGLKEEKEVLVSIIEFILGQGEGSRLYRRLVDEEKVAVAVATVEEQLNESGIFLVLIEPIEGKSEQCKKIVAQELEKFIKDGVTAQELNKVIRTRGREFFQKLQSLQSFTYEWIRSYIATKDEFAFFKNVEEFNTIDSKQIQKFAKQYLDPFFMNQIELFPLPEDKKHVWEKSKKESEKLDQEILSRHPRTAPIQPPKFVNVLPDPAVLDFSFPKPTKTFELDNGLQVILRQNTQWPIISAQCSFRDASFFAEAKEGLGVDLMMTSLIEGTQGSSKKDSVDFFESAGASYSFSIGGASISILNKEYEKVVQHFANVLLKPEFSKSEVSKLQAIFVDLFTRRKDSPMDVAVRLLKNSIYKDHPYNWTFDEAIDLINQASTRDLNKLHKKYVTPQNMILTIVGDFQLDDMEKTINDIFGQWNGDSYKKIEYPKSVFIPNEKIDYFMMRDQVFMLWGQPSKINIYDSDLIPIKVLNLITFESLGSRIYKVREETGLFYNAFGGFAAGASREHGFDYLGSILSLDKLDQAEDKILGVIKELAEKGINKNELNSSQQIYLKGLIDLTSNNEAVAAMMSRLQSFELGFDYYDKVLKRVQNIDVEELNQIAKKYFVVDKMTRVRVGRVGKQ